MFAVMNKALLITWFMKYPEDAVGRGGVSLWKNRIHISPAARQASKTNDK